MAVLKRRFLICGLAATTLACVQSLARADESEGALLFREGRALMLQGKFDEACPKIAESQRLEPHVGTLLNLAACHERVGKIGTAWVEYEKALTAARAEGQADRERLAQDRIAALDARVPWLTLNVVPDQRVDRLTVKLDGAEIEPVAWGKEMPVDPGPHEAAAEAPKHKPFAEHVELHEGEHKSVAVALEEEAPPPEAKPAPLVVEPEVKPVTPESSTTPKPAERGWMLDVGPMVAPFSVGNDFFGDGVAIGGSLVVSHLISERFALGGRLLGGPSFNPDGYLVAAGPTAIGHVAGPAWLGASLFLGGAKLNDTHYANNQPNGRIFDTYLAPGGALNFDLHLFESSQGALVVSGMLCVLAARDAAVAVPLSVAYRFQ